MNTLPNMNTEGNLNLQPEDYTKTGLFKAMSTLMKVMTSVGLFFKKNFRTDSQAEETKRWRCITPSQAYSTVLLLIHWLNFFRILMVFDRHDEFGIRLLFKVVYVLYALSTTLIATLYYQACLKFELLPAVFMSFETFSCNTKKHNLKRIRHRAIVMLVISVVINFIYQAQLIWSYLYSDYHEDRFTPFSKNDSGYLAVKIIILVIDLQFSMATVMRSVLHFCRNICSRIR